MATDKLTDSGELDIEEIEENEVYVSFDIATYPSDFTLRGIVQMWKSEGILIPDFQREFVWDIKQSSLLIESFLLGLPVPSVFFYIDENNANLVIDGQQRILSTVFFFDGLFGLESKRGKRQVFRLKGLSDKSPYANKTYEELSLSDQRKLDNTVLRAINIRQLSPVGESTSMYHIFERLNTGGTPLKSQEIRNVVFRGEFVHILRKLNTDENWRKILGVKNLNKHQSDVELVLRAFAFMDGPEDYEKPMKEFLNIAMKKNQNGDTKKAEKFVVNFAESCKFMIDMIGEKPFHPRGRISTSAMDSIFPLVLNYREKIRTEFKQKFAELMTNEKFIELTTLKTTDESVVKSRYDLVKGHFLN